MTAMDFRMYDNVLGRFFGIDALSEQNHYLSTYQFGDGNPVVFSDPSGLDSQGGYDPKDVWGKHGAGAWANQYTNSQYNAINAGNSAGGSSSSNASASFAELDSKIRNFLKDKKSKADIRTFFYENNNWEGVDGELLPAVTITRSGDKFNIPLNEINKIINDAQRRFNKKYNGNLLSNFWHSAFMRNRISDNYTIGLTSNVAAFIGFGTTPINFTILTRGAPGVYFTPTVNGSISGGIEGNAGVTLSRGLYTGNSRDIKASFLQGHSIGLSAGLGFGPHASFGVSYAPADFNNPLHGGFINTNAQIGVGIEGSPTIINGQLNYQWTPTVVPIIQF